ncbi:MAG: tRNA dihydrouridine synthase DusB, partial [Saprospiraceae bacterium]|nr:tRNA dihydrouridine synthase DusB [Saprospiraceae bacterium]
SVEWKGERQGIFEMRRHYTNYFRGINNFKPFRTELVEAMTLKEIHEILGRVEAEFAGYEFH